MQYIMQIELPDDAVVEGGVLVVGYLDAQGNGKFGVNHDAMQFSGAIGLLNMAAHAVAHVSNHDGLFEGNQ